MKTTIEFKGPPGCGKTLLKTLLEERLETAGIPYENPTENSLEVKTTDLVIYLNETTDRPDR